MWHFPEKSDKLFRDYMNCFLMLKQEASRFPEWVRTEDDRRKFIADYMNHEGIQMDYDKITKTSDLCSLAKLMLNR